ncbi:MAG: MTAP family purine nucleoside phosphorylase, partial [Candidatus Micrarchaeota archaeon]
PGEFVVVRQFVDRTKCREDTFFDGPEVNHPTAADPYCPQLSDLAVAACKQQGVSVHDHGTVVVINGPRFSTRAESQWFSKMGWNVINMTQYPEQMLARELGICYAGIALVTDYDVGFEGVPPVSHEEVMAVFKKNNEKLKGVLEKVVASIPEEKTCSCSKPLG